MAATDPLPHAEESLQDSVESLASYRPFQMCPSSTLAGYRQFDLDVVRVASVHMRRGGRGGRRVSVPAPMG